METLSQENFHQYQIYPDLKKTLNAESLDFQWFDNYLTMRYGIDDRARTRSNNRQNGVVKMKRIKFDDILRYYRKQTGTAKGTEALDTMVKWEIVFVKKGNVITMILQPESCAFVQTSNCTTVRN